MISGRPKLMQLHPQVKEAADWALSWAEYYGIPVTVTSGFRTWQDQERLYADYLAGRSRFPANRPGDSAHNFGLAWDSWVPEEYRSWWDYVRKAAGFEVLPHDWVHAQVYNWRKYV